MFRRIIMYLLPHLKSDETSICLSGPQADLNDTSSTPSFPLLQEMEQSVPKSLHRQGNFVICSIPLMGLL